MINSNNTKRTEVDIFPNQKPLFEFRLNSTFLNTSADINKTDGLHEVEKNNKSIPDIRMPKNANVNIDSILKDTNDESDSVFNISTKLIRDKNPEHNKILQNVNSKSTENKTVTIEAENNGKHPHEGIKPMTPVSGRTVVPVEAPQKVDETKDDLAYFATTLKTVDLLTVLEMHPETTSQKIQGNEIQDNLSNNLETGSTVSGNIFVLLFMVSGSP